MSAEKTNDEKIEEFWKDCVHNISSSYIKLHSSEYFVRGQGNSWTRAEKSNAIACLADLLTEEYKQRFCNK